MLMLFQVHILGEWEENMNLALEKNSETLEAGKGPVLRSHEFALYLIDLIR